MLRASANNTGVHLANEMPACATNVHALHEGCLKRHGFFKLAGIHHKSKALPLGSQAPVQRLGIYLLCCYTG